MAEIHILDSVTVDKIAAGEVVERPLNVVKELVENAVDAEATAVTVEIRQGGIEFVRVTDNGKGIDAEQVKTAFFRHATSKIQSVADLEHIVSLGFRGEALSSIAAVSKVELITKTRESLVGVRYSIEGGKEGILEELGAPDGTTVLVRNLFYNTPVRRKFLKQPVTEAGYIADLMEHLALSHPDISFQYIQNGQVRFHTSGNGNLKEVIYRIYGKEVSNNLVEIKTEVSSMAVSGYLGKPVLNRANRNFETYFVNGRYIKSSLVAKALEEGYREYLMQHKYPFVVLKLDFDSVAVDVNVHPTKMDVRFSDSEAVYDFISTAVAAALKVREMIPEAVLQREEEAEEKQQKAPEPFEVHRLEASQNSHSREFHECCEKNLDDSKKESEKAGDGCRTLSNSKTGDNWNNLGSRPDRVAESMRIFGKQPEEAAGRSSFGNADRSVIKAADAIIVEKPTQLNLFEEKILSPDARGEYRILGQIFETYWIIAFRDKIFFVDQHAAHEKVKYERLIRQYREKQIVSQTLNPPVILTLTGQEEMIFSQFTEYFTELGFEIEDFGGSEYALRSVPMDLYGCNEADLFREVLDELAEHPDRGSTKDPQVIAQKIASMSCKAAVKGNTSLQTREMEALLDELLTLENPYNCPHGRPTIFSMSKYEIEKKFKRIV